MAKRKISCKNILCRHCTQGGCSLSNIVIGIDCRCSSFEKGIVYYFHRVWEALGNCNYIDMAIVDDDLRIGLYYVMKVYELGFSIIQRGGWEVLSLKQGEDGKALKYDDIVALPQNMEVLEQIVVDFNNGKLPEVKYQDFEPDEDESAFCKKPYGWLSPTGDFTEAPFGTHDDAAQEIIENDSFYRQEFSEWMRRIPYDSSNPKTWHPSHRDFLSGVKGYCLIHDPYLGGYIVSHEKPLTKKQREYLFGYFSDMGDDEKAKKYLEE